MFDSGEYEEVSRHRELKLRGLAATHRASKLRAKGSDSFSTQELACGDSVMS